MFVVPIERREDRVVKLLERLVAAHRNPAPDAPRPFQGDLEDVLIAGARLGHDVPMSAANGSALSREPRVTTVATWLSAERGSSAAAPC